MQTRQRRSAGSLGWAVTWVGTLAVVAVCWACVPARASAPPAAPKKVPVKAVKDVTYYDGSGHDKIKHKLDLFLPEGGKGFPVLLFVHGGAWMHGDKSFLGFYSALARSLAAQGIGVVVTNYRLSPGVRHPEHVRDVARAFAWTHKNIAKYGGRPDRLFVCGHSAGGHLVSLLVTDDRYLRDEGLSSKAVRGAIPISGVYDVPNGFLPRVFGTGPDAGKNASPLRHARAGLPPFLVLWADNDFTICGRKPSEAFVKVLKDKGNQVEGREVKDSDHYTIIVSARADGVTGRAILGFVRAHSGK
jgi:acetyl esterase/lipase